MYVPIHGQIKSQHLEYSRCKESHLRKQAKYIKTVKEAEIAIRQRYSALEIENKTGGDRERAQKESLPIDENLLKSFSKVNLYSCCFESLIVSCKNLLASRDRKKNCPFPTSYSSTF